MSFGAKFTWVTLTYKAPTLVPTLLFSTRPQDPADAMVNTTNFPRAA